MEVLFDLLPKDLVYIIQDYAKDKEQYDKVIKELERDVYMITFMGTKYRPVWKKALKGAMADCNHKIYYVKYKQNSVWKKALKGAMAGCIHKIHYVKR